MLTIEREVDLVIDLQSTNSALMQMKDIRSLYQEAIGEDNWEGIFSVQGDNFVIATIGESDWWNGDYTSQTRISREGYDTNDEPVTFDAYSFTELATWQRISRFIEDGYFIVRVEDEDDDCAPLRFKITSGRAEQL